MFASDVTGGEPRNVLAWDSRPRMSSWFFNAKSIYEVETVVKREHRTKQRFASFSRFSPSHLSASTRCSVPARIMTCQCLRSSAISVVIWFLAISSFTRSRHLSFGLPRFLFPSTSICNIFLVASYLSLLCTWPNHLNLFSLRRG